MENEQALQNGYLPQKDQPPLLKVNGLKKYYRAGGLFGLGKTEVKAVDDISFEIYPGKTLGIVGESGSGKTTAAYAVLQLIKVTDGEVIFSGEDITKLHRDQLKHIRRQMQVVFQDPYSSLNPRMTAGATIAEPLIIHKLGTKGERKARVAELLEQVGLDASFANRYPHEFSGGQRQRIGIARALALRPQLIVCDEPVSALDVSIQAQILNLLKDIQDETGVAYLFISHDLAVVRHMSDQIAVMQEGKIVETGDAESVYQYPKEDYTKQLLAAIPRL